MGGKIKEERLSFLIKVVDTLLQEKHPIVEKYKSIVNAIGGKASFLLFSKPNLFHSLFFKNFKTNQKKFEKSST